MWTGAALTDGPHSSLLGSLFEAQKYLAPALLLLYGDVERTGFYEKLTNRRSIMVVLKHLWTLDTHRPAFRGIATVGSSSSSISSAPLPTPSAASGIEEPTSSSPAAAAAAAVVVSPLTSMDIVVDQNASNQTSYELTDQEQQQRDEEEAVALSLSLSIQVPTPAPIEYDSTPDENYFIRFANGLMNETNSLVSMTMERLGKWQSGAESVVLSPCDLFLLLDLPLSLFLPPTSLSSFYVTGLSSSSLHGHSSVRTCCPTSL